MYRCSICTTISKPGEPLRRHIVRKCNRYQTIDSCTEVGCRCDDRAGIVLYDGPSESEAEAACSQARYPDPQIEVIGYGDIQAELPVCESCQSLLASGVTVAIARWQLGAPLKLVAMLEPQIEPMEYVPPPTPIALTADKIKGSLIDRMRKKQRPV